MLDLERKDGQLGWRTADEPVEEHEVLRLDGRQRLVEVVGGATDGDSRFDLESCARSRWERAHRADGAAGDEERLLPARLDRRHDQAELELSQAFKAPQTLDDVLERLDPIA